MISDGMQLELTHDLRDPIARRAVEATERQGDAVRLHRAAELGDGGDHAEAAACSANRSQRGCSRSDSATAAAASPERAARQMVRAGSGSVPPMTEYQASHPALRPRRGGCIARDADRDAVGHDRPDLLDAGTRFFRLRRHPGDLDRGDVRQLGDAGVQRVAEPEVRGARVVVDDHRKRHRGGEVLVEPEHVVVGERLVRHRRQQQAGRPGIGGVTREVDDLGCAQGADADDHGDAARVPHRNPCHPSALIEREVGSGPGRAEGGDRIHSCGCEPRDQAGVGDLVHFVIAHRGEREGAEVGEHASS